ncbi:GNAT family N-acetyltransferase [Streptomyces sp. NA02950]|uniref:GNAT family N-acetyltransferase n=1 Tax=Streptomyces sp. NA02950 TaxID=2742137 RepID=UPI001590FED7|nr:GNAT family N-acetyltransferase [Streptomyces sp. NA02950]QKV91737.1 GNAT family N-acetyltransferase [Streptomyces sp. NA02950]
MAWTTTDDLDTFRTAAGGFLRGRPAEHTVLLTVAASLAAAGSDRYGELPPRYGWWRPGPGTERDGDGDGGGAVEGALLCTPPYPPVLSPLSGDAAKALARVLAERNAQDGPPPPVTGVNAGRRTAETFAAAWERLTGAAAEVDQTHRLYRLRALTPPGPAPPGRARAAGAADRALLLTWYDGFARDTGALRGDVSRTVDDRLSHGGVTLWEVDGAPVSTAAVSRTVAGMVRVSHVYTPPELRGRGYAGAVTAAVSRAARATGAEEVLLFTDLANPTSNALYQRLGYRPLEDHLQLSFTAPGTTPPVE